MYKYLNNFHETIKVTVNYSRTEINFLDVKFFKNDENNQLETTLYLKPTDTHQYLHATSRHHAICRSQYLIIRQVILNVSVLEKMIYRSNY